MHFIDIDPNTKYSRTSTQITIPSQSHNANKTKAINQEYSEKSSLAPTDHVQNIKVYGGPLNELGRPIGELSIREKRPHALPG